MDLRLAVKTEYFNNIKSGAKTREFRLQNEYWMKRIEGRDYDNVVITLGYPKASDKEKILTFPWRGYKKATIRHKHFGDKAVNVYAIFLTPPTNASD